MKGEMTKAIPLRNGMIAIVNDQDYARVMAHNWYASCPRKIWYAVTKIDGKVVSLQRFIMRPPPEHQVDHVNGNPLDCRRSNMRPCTNKENSRNRGPRSDSPWPYKGIRRRYGHWTARVRSDGITHDLGTFDSPEAAARAYDTAAVEHHGAFARLNFP